MAHTVKQRDGTTRREGRRARRGRSSAFVELVAPPAHGDGDEAVCEVVLVSGHRLVVREAIDEARLRQLVRALRG